MRCCTFSSTSNQHENTQNTETEKKKKNCEKRLRCSVSQSHNGTPKGHLGAQERRTVRRDSEEDSQRRTGNGSTES